MTSDLFETRYCAECGRETLHRFCKRCRKRMKKEGVGQSEMPFDDESKLDDHTIDTTLDTLMKDDPRH